MERGSENKTYISKPLLQWCTFYLRFWHEISNLLFIIFFFLEYSLLTTNYKLLITINVIFYYKFSFFFESESQKEEDEEKWQVNDRFINLVGLILHRRVSRSRQWYRALKFNSANTYSWAGPFFLLFLLFLFYFIFLVSRIKMTRK